MIMICFASVPHEEPESHIVVDDPKQSCLRGDHSLGLLVALIPILSVFAIFWLGLWAFWAIGLALPRIGTLGVCAFFAFALIGESILTVFFPAMVTAPFEEERMSLWKRLLTAAFVLVSTLLVTVLVIYPMFWALDHYFAGAESLGRWFTLIWTLFTCWVAVEAFQTGVGFKQRPPGYQVPRVSI